MRYYMLICEYQWKNDHPKFIWHNRMRHEQFFHSKYSVVLDCTRDPGTECCKSNSVIFSQSELSVQKSKINRENIQESQ